MHLFTSVAGVDALRARLAITEASEYLAAHDLDNIQYLPGNPYDHMDDGRVEHQGTLNERHIRQGLLHSIKQIANPAMAG